MDMDYKLKNSLKWRSLPAYLAGAGHTLHDFLIRTRVKKIARLIRTNDIYTCQQQQLRYGRKIKMFNRQTFPHGECDVRGACKCNLCHVAE